MHIKIEKALKALSVVVATLLLRSNYHIVVLNVLLRPRNNAGQTTKENDMGTFVDDCNDNDCVFDSTTSSTKESANSNGENDNSNNNDDDNDSFYNDWKQGNWCWL